MSYGKQGLHYGSQAKEIIMNVWNYFRRERDAPPGDEESQFGSRRANAAQKTLEATGVKSRSTLYKIEREGFVKPKKRGPKRRHAVEDIDDFDRGAIRQTISEMYKSKQWPTVDSILQQVKANIGFTGSKTTFIRLLKDMGYEFKKRSTRSHLKERPDIVAKRYEYLIKIKQIRQLTDCTVVYLDETFLHQNHVKSKCWMLGEEGGLNVPTEKGNRIIILHAGSKHGFIPGAELIFQSKTKSSDYHDEMNGEAFVEWFTNQLLPNIPQNSCIVMDNASYHSMLQQKIPTMSSRKAEMQQWLTSIYDIGWDPSMIKPQLYHLIKLHKPNCMRHVIDELARKHRHQILRLPPYHAELNPIELIWAQAKGDVAQSNTTFKMTDVMELLKNALAKITPERWAAVENHVIELENKLYEDEVKIDTTVPEDDLNTFHFYIDDSDSSSGSDSESDDEEQYFGAVTSSEK